MKKGKIEINWKDLITELPYNPKGYSSVQQIADKTGRSCVTVRNALNYNKVPFIYGMTTEKRKARFYKD